MQIRDLQSTSTVESTDYLVKEQSDGMTQKITVGDFVVNDLTSTLTDKPLSAAQGKALNEKIRVITNSHLNTNAYNAGSNGWEDFTFQETQWPDGYDFGGFSAGGAGNGLLSLCKVDYNSAQKLVRLLLRNDTSTNIAANVTTVQCNVIIIHP